MIRILCLFLFSILSLSIYSQKLEFSKDIDSVNISVYEYDTVLLPPDTIFLPTDTIYQKQKIVTPKVIVPEKRDSKKLYLEFYGSIFNLQWKNNSAITYNRSISSTSGIHLKLYAKHVFYQTGIGIDNLYENKNIYSNQLNQSVSKSNLLEINYKAEIHNQYVLLNLPLSIGYHSTYKKVSFYISGGVVIGYIVFYKSSYLNPNTGSIDFITLSSKEKFSSAFNFSSGLSYNITEQWSIRAGACFRKTVITNLQLPQAMNNGYIAVCVGIQRKIK